MFPRLAGADPADEPACPASRRAILARGHGVRESAEMTLVEPGHESS